MVHRSIRYQGAVIHDHHILLLKQIEHASGRSYWLLPGGRMEPYETEERCVQREVLEETSLQVQVQRLLLDEPNISGRSYQRRKTYLCSVLDGEARLGYEPEAEYAAAYSFIEVGWFDLRRSSGWNEQIVHDPITYPLLQQLQSALGYLAAERSSDSHQE
jgi:ADP-ribose pyrophosphatase YjhB (NUDIX family)